MNGFPYFTWGDVAGIADPTLLQRIADRLPHWRFMGVLQRIGIAYMVAALLTQRTTLRQQAVIIAALLLRVLVRDDAAAGTGRGDDRARCC